MENNPYHFIFQTLEVTEKILSEAENPNLDQSEKTSRFLTLVLLERVLDKERVFVPAGSAGKFPEIKKQMEERYGNFRAKLWSLGKQLNPEELKHELEFLGESLKSRFISLAFNYH